MDKQGSRRDDQVALALALMLVAGTVALAHLLPAAHGSQRPPPTPASSAADPRCAEWTDGCIVCQRTEQGLACSTPGIACLPRERQCLRREGA